MDRETRLEVAVPTLTALRRVETADALLHARENNPSILSQKQAVLEARQTVDKTRKDNRFSASLNASVGYNQVGDNLSGAYRNLLRQDLVSLSVSIPLVDWGVRKGRLNMALSNLDVAEISERQQLQSLDEEVTVTVDDYNIQLDLITSAKEAMDLAERAYAQTQQRFMIGKTDLSSMTLASTRRQEASKNYISALKNYWLNYYKLRRLTLFDFETGIPLTRKFDLDNNVR